MHIPISLQIQKKMGFVWEHSSRITIRVWERFFGKPFKWITGRGSQWKITPVQRTKPFKIQRFGLGVWCLRRGSTATKKSNQKHFCQNMISFRKKETDKSWQPKKANERFPTLLKKWSKTISAGEAIFGTTIGTASKQNSPPFYV